jgi:hypothetical protein
MSLSGALIRMFIVPVPDGPGHRKHDAAQRGYPGAAPSPPRPNCRQGHQCERDQGEDDDADDHHGVSVTAARVNHQRLPLMPLTWRGSADQRSPSWLVSGLTLGRTSGNESTGGPP